MLKLSGFRVENFHSYTTERWDEGALFTRAWGAVTIEIWNLSLSKKAESIPLQVNALLEITIFKCYYHILLIRVWGIKGSRIFGWVRKYHTESYMACNKLTFKYIWTTHLFKNIKACALVRTKTSKDNNKSKNITTATLIFWYAMFTNHHLWVVL